MINYQQFELFGVEAKKRLKKSQVILHALVFPIAGIAIIIWFLELFKILPGWTAWPFIAVLVSLIVYVHFNNKKAQKLIDKRQEFVESFKGG